MSSKEHRRKHDDAHRPMAGRGHRGNVPRSAPRWGDATLVETARCAACGQFLPHGYFGCSATPKSE